MSSFPKPPVLRVITGGRDPNKRRTTEERFNQALSSKENAAALAEIMKARRTSPELRAKQLRLLQKLRGDSTGPVSSTPRRRLALALRAPTADVVVSDQGSIFLVTPQTHEARQWIRANVVSEASQWFGPSLVVEHRFIAKVVEGMQSAGLRVE